MLEILVPLALALFLCVPILLLSTRGLGRASRARLNRHLLIGFALRVALATLFAVAPSLRVFHEDAGGYEMQAMRISSGWNGDHALGREAARYLVHRHNVGPYYAFAAILYVVGPYPLALSIVNALIGTLSALVLYRIGRRLFNEVIARRSAMFSLYFPSMIVWSSMALKDPFVGLAILVTTLFCIRLRERASIANFAGTLLPIIAIYPIRFYLVYPLIISVVATLAISRGGRLLSSMSKQLALVGVVVALVVGVGFLGKAREDLEFFDLQQVSNYRRSMATTASSGFSGDADVSTAGSAIAFLPIGVTALMWSPFPWQMVSLRPLLTLPEMLLWWACIPALFRGVRLAVRRRFADVSPLLFFVATLLIGYSLTMGNVGAAFRMRAQVLHLLFLFASLGHYLQIAQRKGLAEDVLWGTPSTTSPPRVAAVRTLEPRAA